MSIPSQSIRITVPEISARKGGEKIVCLTAYSATTARLIDPYVDMLLVGDSLGMVLYGLESTVGVTLDMMVVHGAAVMRGAKRACVIVDLPFGSYQESPEAAFRSAARVMTETGDGFQIAEEDLELRGPGEFFGTRQSGMPELRLGNIVSDMKLMESARQEAFSLVKEDPRLQRSEHHLIKEYLLERFKGRLELFSVG